MSEELLKKYLAGKANDAEILACERMLGNPETVVNELSTISEDSLLAALSNQVVEDPTILEQAESFARRIEGSLNGKALNLDEFKSLLDSSDQLGDLGRIANYRVVEFLDHGGMGIVFRGIDDRLGRAVCIKLLNPAFQFNAEMKARFQRESCAAAQLIHDRIVTIIDVGEQKGIPWFAMPLLEGQTLRKRIQQDGPLPIKLAIDLCRQIAEGVAHAHSHGLLHRDLKPENIWLIAPNNQVKILDFGLARLTEAEGTPLTHSGGIIGTPRYMSPEQIAGKPIDERSDLFSLGVVLVEMLIGKSPFQRNNMISTMMAIASETLNFDEIDSNNQIPPAFRDLVNDLLQRDTSQRISSAPELIERLNQLETNPHITKPATKSVRARTWRKNLVMAMLGVIFSLGAMWLVQMQDKGTLVVESSDPHVEIKIENEKVFVRDLVSGKAYEIKIGSTPLPSGVYQLETDASEALSFSSQSITIRRGERAIVRVELRPPEKIEGRDPKMSLGGANRVTSDSEPETWADKSYDPKIRESFGDILKSLPAREIVANSDGNEVPSLADFATVTRPSRIPGIASWSLESPANGTEFISNCDDTLFASHHQASFVSIVDKDNQVKHLIPSRGSLIRFKFDDRWPNLIAISSYIVPKVGEEPKKNSYEISIWRLSEGYAELLDRVTSGNYGEFTWDNGYRICLKIDDAVGFYRLDNHSFHEIDGLICDQATSFSISPNSEYLQTSKNQASEIWNLKLGKFEISVPAYTVHWRDDSKQLAIQENSKILIYELPNASPIKQIDLPPVVVDQYKSKRVLANRMSANFRHVAFVSADGQLTIRNTENNRQNTIPIELPKDSVVGLRWEGNNSFRLNTRSGMMRWLPTLSDVHGEFVPISENLRPKKAEVDRGSIESVWNNKINLVSKSRIRRIDLANSTVVTKSSTAGSQLQRFFSPDGRFMVQLPQRSTISSGKEMPKVEPKIIDLESNREYAIELLRGSGWRNNDLAVFARFSDDSRFFLFVDQSLSTPRASLQLFDFVSGETSKLPDIELRPIRPVENASNSRQQRPQAFFVRGAFYVFGGPKNLAWKIDPNTKSVETLEGFSEGDMPRVTRVDGDGIYFEKIEANPDDTIRQFTRAVEYRGKFDGKSITQIEKVEYPKLTNPGEYAFSSDRKFSFYKSYFSETRVSAMSVYQVEDWLGGKTQPLFEASGEFDYNKIKWHSRQNVVHWFETRENQARFFDVAKLKDSRVFHTDPSWMSTDWGWMTHAQIPVFDGNNSLLAYGPTGEYLGTFAMPQDPEAQNPRWILNDGSISANDDLRDLFVVTCESNRIITRPASEFANSKKGFPARFEQVPFLNSNHDPD